MAAHIFYSWQSDVEPGAACRSFIHGALEKAIDRIASDASVDEAPRLDQDTQGIAGSVDIAAIILEKIDNADVFVADVTLVGTTLKGKPTPNPNVLLELGYAIKSRTWNRVLMVMNTAVGGGIEQLPFDLRGKRVIPYSSAPDAAERATEKNVLAGRLETALRLVLSQPKQSKVAAVEATLTVVRKDTGKSEETHSHQLVSTIENISDRRLEDWEIEVNFPTPFLTGIHYAAKVDSRSNERNTVFVWTSKRLAEPLLRPGEKRPIAIDYIVTKAHYDRRSELFGLPVKVTGSIDGKIFHRFEKTIGDLQNF